MVLKLPKITISKKCKSIKAIYLYPSERPHCGLAENGMFYRGLSNSSRDIEEYNIKKMLIQQKFSKIHQLQTLISSKI